MILAPRCWLRSKAACLRRTMTTPSGWCNNPSPFFRSRVARVACQRVLASLKSAQRSPDATHIKINIISNLTMLDEFEKNIKDALARWSFFDSMLNHAGPVFAKHHLFRKAGLLVKTGRWE